MQTSQEIFDAAFDGPREPRSAEYRAGVMAALRYHIDGVGIECQWSAGSAKADAFWAGTNEGFLLCRGEGAADV